MDREAWRAVIHGVSKSRIQLSDLTELNRTGCPELARTSIGDEFRKSSFEGPGEDLQFYAVTSCWKLLSGGFDLN